MQSSAILDRLAAQHLFDLSIEFSDMHLFAVPGGTRITAVTSGGEARGPRLAGSVLPGGGDWIVVGPDAIARLDVRVTIRVDSGDLVHLTSQGRAVMDDVARATFLAGGAVRAPALFARSTSQFETSGEGLEWLNACSAVGVVTELSQRRIEYRYFGLV